MKLLITGDWHLDTYRPRNRTDDYFETQSEKIQWILHKAEQEGCYTILQPGDMFNSHRANDFLKQYYIDRFKYMRTDINGHTKPPYIHTIFGQHDLRFHSSDRDNTPLKVLEVADAITLLDNDSLSISEEGIFLYGTNWGEDIPEPCCDEGVHILLIHKLVVEDIEGWERSYISTENMFRFSKHDIIVCGDNHLSFVAEKCDDVGPTRLLFNCGSLMRSRIDQAEHRPRVYIVDTVDLQYEEHFIPVKPIEEVMNIEKAEQEKERNEQLEAFVSKLTGDVNIEGLDFLHNLETYIAENEVEKPVKEFINEVVAGEE